ncbi:MAG: CtkA family protein, partial [Clostridiales bacterium]|nr:CtkA family protein [Clostridiales bacterium]
FIVDALIGNWDRHNGNWGFLYNTVTDEVKLAPVYDCGSCLYPQADDVIMTKVLSEQKELDFRVFEIPTSAITVNNRKIRYFDFISSLQQEACNLALKRIVPKIDMARIKDLIEGTPFLSDLQRKFYFTMLTERKSRILDFAMKAMVK